MRWVRVKAPAPDVPPSKRYAACAVSVGAGRLILYGGTQGGTTMAELWLLTCAPGAEQPAWSRPSVAGAAPPARCAHSASVLAGEARVAVFGGEGATGTLNDLAVLGLYDEPPPPPPPAAGKGSGAERVIYRDETIAEVEEATEKVTLSRRERPVDPIGPPLALRWLHHFAPPPPPAGGADARADEPGGADAPAAADGAPAWPCARKEHAAAALFDGGLLVHGGTAQGLEPLADLWLCRLDGADGAPVWARPDCSGRPPPAAAGHSASALGVRVVLLGGALMDTAHVLDAAAMAWSTLEPARSELLARAGHAAVPAGRAVLLFGGVDALTDEPLGGAAELRLGGAAGGGAGEEAPAASVGPLGVGRSAAKPPGATSGACAARAGSVVFLLGGRGSSHLGELAGVAEEEAERARREEEEEALEEEAQGVLRERRQQEKKGQKQRKAEQKKQQQAAAADEAARLQEGELRARAERDAALRERGEALAAQAREEQRRRAKEEREAKEALKASRVGGGYRLEPAAGGASGT